MIRIWRSTSSKQGQIGLSLECNRENDMMMMMIYEYQLVYLYWHRFIIFTNYLVLAYLHKIMVKRISKPLITYFSRIFTGVWFKSAITRRSALPRLRARYKKKGEQINKSGEKRIRFSESRERSHVHRPAHIVTERTKILRTGNTPH